MSLDVQPTTALNIITQLFRTSFKRPLPAGLTAELDRITAEENATVADIFRGPVQALDRAIAAAAIKAVSAGKDPSSDKAVTAALNRRALRENGIEQELHSLAAERRATALDRHADAIFAELADIVTVADQVITDARATVPNLDLTSTESAGMTPAQVGAWAAARQAYAVLGDVIKAWGFTASACRLVQWPAPDPALVLADVDAAQLAELNGTDALSVVRAGHRLKLATPEEFLERSARVEAQQRTEAERRSDEEYRLLRSRISPISMG